MRLRAVDAQMLGAAQVREICYEGLRENMFVVVDGHHRENRMELIPYFIKNSRSN